jgi:hypothetical protein
MKSEYFLFIVLMLILYQENPNYGGECCITRYTYDNIRYEHYLNKNKHFMTLHALLLFK